MAKHSEPLVRAMIDDIEAWKAEGAQEWAQHRRWDEKHIPVVLASAEEAARRLGMELQIDVVPGDFKGVIVQTLPGTQVVRVSDHPAPWNRGVPLSTQRLMVTTAVSSVVGIAVSMVIFFMNPSGPSFLFVLIGLLTGTVGHVVLCGWMQRR